MESVNKKLLLSTSQDGDVVVAEVARNHKKDPRSNEFFISRDTLRVNVESGNFVEVSDKVDWDGRMWILSEDIMQ